MTALLVVGHGTRDPEGVAGFTRLVDLIADRVDVLVAGGFIELSPPPLREVVADLVGHGQRQLGVVPLMLATAGHAKGDIPGALQRECERHPGLQYRYGRPLGPHPTLLELIEDRIDAVLPVEDRPDTAVVLVGRGSSDPDANAEHAKVARLLWEGRGFAGVEPAFISLATPGVPAALDRAKLLGAQRIVVVPYFLFAGVLPSRVVQQAEEWAVLTGIDVRCTGVIGAVPQLADLVIERWQEALHGDIRMNCDTCLYRTSLPGHELRVGAPQRPHHHPDDPVGDKLHEHPHAARHLPTVGQLAR